MRHQAEITVEISQHPAAHRRSVDQTEQRWQMPFDAADQICRLAAVLAEADLPNVGRQVQRRRRG